MRVCLAFILHRLGTPPIGGLTNPPESMHLVGTRSTRGRSPCRSSPELLNEVSKIASLPQVGKPIPDPFIHGLALEDVNHRLGEAVKGDRHSPTGESRQA